MLLMKMGKLKETVAIAILLHIISMQLKVVRRDVDAAILASNKAIEAGRSGASAYEIGIRQIDMAAGGRSVKTTAAMLG